MMRSVAVDGRDVPVLEDLFGMESKNAIGSGTKTETKVGRTAHAVAMLSPGLISRANALSTQCRRFGFDTIHPIAAGPTIKTPVYYPLNTPHSMIIMPANLDPTRSGRGRIPIPADVQRRLKRAVDAGIEFDHIYIAHEMDGRPLGTAPRSVTLKEATAHVPRPPATATARGIHKTLSGVAALGRKALGAAGAGVSAIAATGNLLLDPAVIGVLVDETGDSGVWFGVDSWTW